MKLSNLNTIVTPANIDPTYLTNLVKEITVRTATNQITFDNLDGNNDEGYILECDINNTSGTSENVGIYCNNDLTNTNYYKQFIWGTGTTLSNFNTNEPQAIYATTGTHTNSKMDISPTFFINVQSGNNGSGTNGHIMVGSVWKTTPPTNITRLDLKSVSANTFGVSSKFKLYRKKLNPALVLSSRYLSNLVEEIRVTADCSSVTFSNLDSNLDGDYILEARIINPIASDKAANIFINGDSVKTNYWLNGWYKGSNGTLAGNAGNAPTLYGLKASGELYSILKLSVIDGKVMGFYDGFQSGTHTNKDSYTLITNQSSITSMSISADDATNAIGAGSTFRLYKTNSGTLRPGPSFSAHKNGVNQSIPSDVAKVTFTLESKDSHNCYDANNSVFTPNVAGSYLFNIQLHVLSPTTGQDYEIKLYKNGSQIFCTKSRASSAYDFTLAPLSYIVDANGSTDYFEAYTFFQDSKNISGDSSLTVFQAVKVG